MKKCRIAGLLTIMLVMPFLQGCLVGMVAAQVFPAVIGGGAIFGSEDRDPFRIPVGNETLPSDIDLAMLDTQIQKADCGDAEAQYWVASALQNNFNTTPNNTEIYKWYRLAEVGRYEPATQELQALAGFMSESEITDAEQRVQEWQAITQGC
jgi:hypothetical protein